MLNCIAAKLPIGQNEWQVVAALPPGETIRSVDSIKLKYQTLRKTPKPTGDAVIPDVVLRAKAIWVQIEQKTGAGELSAGEPQGMLTTIIIF